MPDLDLSAGIVATPPPRKSSSRLPDLLTFAQENNLQVGSTTGGRHNAGSKHYTANAMDIHGSGGWDDATVKSLAQKASERGFLLRDERKHPPGQKVWGGPHVHIEADDGPMGIDLSAGIDRQQSDSEIDLSAGLEQRSTSSSDQDAASGQQPSITDTLDKLTADVKRNTAKIKPEPPSPYNVEDILAQSRRGRRSLTFEEDRAQRVRAQDKPNLRQAEDASMAKYSRVRRSVESDRAIGSDFLSARPQPRESVDDEIVRRLSGEHEQEVADSQRQAQYEKDKPEINRLATKYRQAIHATGLLPELGTGKWSTEMLAKGVAPLVEKFAGLGRASGSPGSEAGADVLRLHAQALRQAAEDEGVDRNEASKFAQNTMSGFIGSAPELAAMSVGVPAPIVFGVGAGVEAYGAKRPVAPAVVHGAATGAAYEIPGVGQGATEIVTKGLATGAASTGIELAAGASPKEAITSGLTNALMRSGPEAARLRSRSKVDATTNVEDGRGIISPDAEPMEASRGAAQSPIVSSDVQAIEHHSASQPRRTRNTESGARGQFKKQQVRLLNADEAAEGAKPRVRLLNDPQSESAVTLTPRQQGVRSFPESVKEAGYSAESSIYDVLPNADTVKAADATIKAKGLDHAVNDLSNKSTEFTPEDVAVGIRAIQQHTASSNIQKSVDVAETLAQRLTAAGQTVQAASLVARLSPEGTLLRAQRLLPKGEKLTSDQGEKLVAASKEVVKHETKLASLSDRIAQMQSEATAASKGKIGTLQDRLTKLETEARARLAARVGKAGSGAVQPLGGINVAAAADIADYAIIGAAKLARKGVTLASWTNEMVKEFGEGVRPQLKSIYRESYRHYDEQRKQFAQEREVRSATKANPAALDIQAVINERALARKDARTARSQLRSLYNDLSLTRWGKTKSVAGDLIGIPRTLKSSVDLSAPRQGAMWMVNHPVQGAKLFFGKQLKAMRTVNYDRFADQLESDLDFPLMTRSKLALTTTDARPNALGGREEAFMSRIAAKIPGVSHSERAYTTFLDTARASWFKQLKNQAESRAKADGKPLTQEHYDAIANFVNIATGRGNLGKGTLNKISPFLNAVFFAPKFAASKVQIFDPRVYARLPKGARATAMREAVTYFGAMTTTALLLKYGLGATVGMNPEDSEFMKARVGNTRYDLANGTGQYVTLAARLLRNAENKRTGKKDEFGKSFMENVDRFTRYKYSPPASFVRNVYEGKNAIGEKTSVSKESIEMVTPLFLKDLYDAYREEGLTGVAKTSPGLVGVGVNTYGDRPPKPSRGKLKF